MRTKSVYGVRRQSAEATALWLQTYQWPGRSQSGSGVAPHLPPHSKIAGASRKTFIPRTAQSGTIRYRIDDFANSVLPNRITAWPTGGIVRERVPCPLGQDRQLRHNSITSANKANPGEWRVLFLVSQLPPSDFRVDSKHSAMRDCPLLNFD